MQAEPILVSLSEIAALSGLSRTAVANWPSRYKDFPSVHRDIPSGSLYSLDEVERWSIEKGRISQPFDPAKLIWKIADSLRGSLPISEIGSSLISAIVFLEAGRRAESHETGISEFPRTLHWREIKSTRLSDIGTGLKEAASTIEGLNPHLTGVVEKGLSVLSNQLHQDWLIRLFDSIEKVLHEEYGAIDPFEEVITRYYDTERSSGESSTPRDLEYLMSCLVEPVGKRILDPCIGTGGLLLMAAQSVLERGETDSIVGYDVSSQIIQIALARLWIYGFDAVIETRNSLTSTSIEPASFDTVVVDPPFGLRMWGSAETYLSERWIYGTPPVTSADTAWLQLAVEALSPNGKAVVALPSGSGFRGGAEQRIRQAMLDAGVVESVIFLPSKLRANTSSPLALWTLRSPTKEDRNRDDVLLVDASGFGKVGRSMTTLDESEIDDIVHIVNTYRNESIIDPRFDSIAIAIAVTNIIEADLTPKKYLKPPKPNLQTLKDEILRSQERLSAGKQRANASIDDFMDLLGTYNE